MRKLASGIFLFQVLPPWIDSKHSNRRAYLERSCLTMGTIATVSAYGESRSHINHAVDKVFAEFQRIDRLMSVFRLESRLSQINAAAGRNSVHVDRDLIKVLKAARAASRATSGMFDVTVEPLMRLWGFRPDSHITRRPSDREIEQRVQAVGWRNVIMDESANTVGLALPQSKIDLGGIAVGFSVDLAVRILRSEGIESAFVNHGGDAYALGKPEENQGWSVAIPDPENTNEVITSIELGNLAVSTSGNYEKFVTVDSQHYGHVLNPYSGKPSGQHLSLTVVAQTSTQADAYATAMFSMDKQRIAQMRHELHISKVIVVDSDQKVEMVD